MGAFGIALDDEVHHQSIGLALDPLSTDARPTSLMKAHGLGAVEQGRSFGDQIGATLFARFLLDRARPQLLNAHAAVCSARPR